MNIATLLRTSLEFAAERGEEFIREAGTEAHEVGEVIFEAGKEAVTGIKLDMKGSLNFNQPHEGETAKSPELMEAEEKNNPDLMRVRNFLGTFNEGLARIQQAGPEVEYDSTTVEVVSLGEEQWNGLLHLQTSLSKEKNLNKYLISAARTAKINMSKPQNEKPVDTANENVPSAILASMEGGAGDIEKNGELAGAGGSTQVNMSNNAGG